jgi:hypothetical protein
MAFKIKNRKEHFLRNVQKTESCWLWRGCTQLNGYGVYGMDYKIVRAHRASYVIFKGAIPKGLLVLHSCDNRLCVNPEHLRTGTHKDNSRDAIKRNRQIRGSGHGRSKISEEYVLHLRKQYDGKHGSIKRLADKEGLSKELVRKILKRLLWTHI